MKKLLFSSIVILSSVTASFAQNSAILEGKVVIYVPLPVQDDLSQKYKFGGGAIIGASIFIPKSKIYISPRIGFDFMPRNVGSDDTYKENLITYRFGIEGMYQLVKEANYELLPLIGVDMKNANDAYKVANNTFYSNGGQGYDKLPPLFTTSAPSISLGLENRFGNFSVRLIYEYYNPTVKAQLNNSYDDIDNDIFTNSNTKLNLSTFSIGFATYVGSRR